MLRFGKNRVLYFEVKGATALFAKKVLVQQQQSHVCLSLSGWLEFWPEASAPLLLRSGFHEVDQTDLKGLQVDRSEDSWCRNESHSSLIICLSLPCSRVNDLRPTVVLILDNMHMPRVEYVGHILDD